MNRFHERHDTALIIFDHLEKDWGSNIVWSCNKELDVLLKWKGIAVSRMDNMSNREERRIIDNGKTTIKGGFYWCYDNTIK